MFGHRTKRESDVRTIGRRYGAAATATAATTVAATATRIKERSSGPGIYGKRIPPPGFPDATFGIDIQAVIRHLDPVGERSWDGQKDRPALPI